MATILEKLRKHYRKILLIGVPVLIVGAAVAVLLLNRQQPTVAPEPITYSTDTPSEVPPQKDTYHWIGGQDEPKYITLPTVGAEGFLQTVGVDQNKQVAVPNNIYMGGWFVDSAKPGQKGLSIIDGHVNGRQNDAIFTNLHNLKAGDQFSVELGSGEVKRYKVMSVTSVATGEAASLLFSQSPKVASQLNLITCSGNFDEKAITYDQRLIVTAELL